VDGVALRAHDAGATTDTVRAGLVSGLKGSWLATGAGGQAVAAPCPATHADLANGACFNDARVEVAATEADAGRG
jgi:hypothetical protein